MRRGIRMGKRLTRLSEEDRMALEQVVRKSPDWRARERVKTLLLSQPLLSREVAKLQNLHINRARPGSTGSEEGMDGLSDIGIHDPSSKFLIYIKSDI